MSKQWFRQQSCDTILCNNTMEQYYGNPKNQIYFLSSIKINSMKFIFIFDKNKFLCPVEINLRHSMVFHFL